MSDPQYPVRLDARRGPAQPPVVLPAPRPATQLRRRVRELARAAGLVDLPRVFSVPIVQASGGSQGTVQWSPSEDQGPLIVVGIEGLDKVDLVTGGDTTIRLTVNGRPITRDFVNLSDGDGRWSTICGTLDLGPSELPAPILVHRGEILSAELLTSGGGVLVGRAALRFHCLALVEPDRSPAGAAADAVARQLADEGELWIVQQTITANTPQLESTFIATSPVLWHGQAITGLDAITLGTWRQSVGGSPLWRGNGAEDGLSQLPVTAAGVLLWYGDVAQQRSERLVSSLAGGAVGAGSIVALWVGRVWR